MKTNMKLKLKISLLVLVMIFSYFVLGRVCTAIPSIYCPNCYVGNCQCDISGCSSGKVRIYETSDCSGTAKYTKYISGNTITWGPPQAKTYYLKVLCNDLSKSACTSVTVSSVSTTTSTSFTTSTSTTSTTSTSFTTSTSTTTPTTSTSTTVPPPTCNLRIIEANPPSDTPSGSEAKARVRVENEGPSTCYGIVKCDYLDPLPDRGHHTDPTSDCERINSGSSKLFYPGKIVTEIGTWDVVSCSVYSSLLSGCSDITDPPVNEWLNIGTFDVYSGVTTTTSTTSTSTTSPTTSTSTTSPTTSTSTTTSTTTTTITLECEFDQIYVEESNECSIYGCDAGLWIVTNYVNKPLDFPKVDDIPPTEIFFGPVREEGEILTRAICLQPAGVLRHTTTVKLGVIITCPESCVVDTTCKCEILGCNDGVFYLTDSQGNAIDVVDVSVSPFNYTFNRSEEGKVSARVFCIVDDNYLIRKRNIDIVGLTTTTTIPGEEIIVSDVDCDEDECQFNIERNTISGPVVIFIWLFDQPGGKIYYSETYDVDAGKTGEIEVSLDEVETCPEDTELFVLLEAYRESDLDERLERIKEEAFECD